MTRRRSLAGRLSRALAVCVALALIVMVAASTLVMRSWMLGNMDSELHRLAQRAGEHLDVDDAPDPKVEGATRTRALTATTAHERCPSLAAVGHVLAGRSFPVGPRDPASAGLAFPRAHSSM